MRETRNCKTDGNLGDAEHIDEQIAFVVESCWMLLPWSHDRAWPIRNGSPIRFNWASLVQAYTIYSCAGMT